MRLIGVLLTAAISLAGQDAVGIKVHASEPVGSFKPIYSYFGYDEPNFTYTKNGRKLVGELAALSSAPVYIRTHFMLATGDGRAGFKFGSTNAYTEDAAGKAIYDWTIVDRIIGTYLEAGAKPFVPRLGSCLRHCRLESGDRIGRIGLQDRISIDIIWSVRIRRRIIQSGGN